MHAIREGSLLSADSRHLELQAMLQICSHALAHSLEISYPTLITTMRGLAHKWRREPSCGGLRGQASRLVRAFLSIGCQPVTDADIQGFAAQCLSQLEARGRLALRTYVALTEAFNSAVTRTFLARREWLCPWSRWNGYIYRPLWEHEEGFILVTAALGGTDADAVGADMTGMPPVRVLETVSKIARAASRVQMRSPPPPGTATADWLEVTASRVRQTYLVGKWLSELVAALQWYLFSGQLLLCRRWWGYKLALAQSQREQAAGDGR